MIIEINDLPKFIDRLRDIALETETTKDSVLLDTLTRIDEDLNKITNILSAYHTRLSLLEDELDFLTGADMWDEDLGVE